MGVDDVSDVALTQRGGNVVRVHAELAAHTGANAVLAQELGRARRGLDVEAQVVEPADQRQRFLLVLVGYGGQHSAVILKLHARGLKRLVQRAVQARVVADGLAGGLHLGGQIRVQTADLGQREHWNLDVPALLLVGIEVEDALLLQRDAEDGAGGDVREAVARGLGQERHGARRAGIDLDDVDVFGLVHDELDVVQAHDAQTQPQLLGVAQDDSLHAVGDAEGRIDADGVAAVHAGALDQLHDAGHEHVAAVADRVHLDLLAENVVVDQHGLLRVHVEGGLQILAQLRLGGDDLHGAAAQHEAGAHQHGIAHLFGGANALLDAGDGAAGGLGNVQLMENVLERVAVFGVFDGLHVRADDLHAAILQRSGEVDRRLAAEGGDDLVRALVDEDVVHVLGGQRLEVQLVRGGVVGGDRLGVVVDDDGLVAGLTDGGHGVHGGVVEFHALADADRARAQHHHLLAVGDDGLVLSKVAGVEIGDVRAGVAGVHHAVDGHHAALHAQIPDCALVHVPQPGDAGIGEAQLLRLAQGLRVHGMLGHDALKVHDLLEGLEEEGRDLGGLVDAIHGNAQTQQLRDGVEVVVAEFGDVAQQLLGGFAVELGHVDVVDADLQRAHGLQQALLEIAADAHDLAGGLHLGAQTVAGRRELVEGEAGQLGHHVVEARLEGGGGVGDLDVLQIHAHGDLRRHAGDGIAAGLAGEGGGAGHAGVDLDEEVLGGMGIQRELHIAAALDLQRADDLDGAVVEHLQVVVAEGHDGRDDDGVAGVHAHGIHVFHAADGDGVVVAVAHDLELDLLVALDALLDEHLMHRREAEGVGRGLDELFLVVGEAAAGAAQRERGAQHHGIADFLSRLTGLVDGIGDAGGNDRLADLLAQLLEQLAVLGALDGAAVGAQQLDLALLQHALLLQLHGQIQARLTADARNDGVGTLIAQDARHVFQRQRLHVHLVGDGGVGHDGRGIGVHQNDLVALLLQREAGLSAGVVELGRLTDDDGAGADNHDFLQIRSLGHLTFPPISYSRRGRRSFRRRR